MLSLLVSLTLAQATLGGGISDAERREVVAKATPEELDKAMRETPVKELIEMGQRAVAALGTYSYRMHKQERVKGEMHPVQEILATVREVPFAARLEFIKGPGAGRRLLYNPAVRKDQFRVKEAGVLSILGGLWIDVDSSLARKDSNHSVREAGMGNLLARFMRDYDRAAPLGGFAVKHEGWNDKGHYCSVWTSPNNGLGFDAAFSRICTDLKTGMPAKVETFDPKHTPLEKYEFSEVKGLEVSEDFFKLEGAKL